MRIRLQYVYVSYIHVVLEYYGRCFLIAKADKRNKGYLNFFVAYILIVPKLSLLFIDMQITMTFNDVDLLNADN